jgi:Cdc6-like AAA superfamily ATPase
MNEVTGLTTTLNERLQELESKIKEVDRFLHTKVDCEIYDEEI